MSRVDGQAHNGHGNGLLVRDSPCVHRRRWRRHTGRLMVSLSDVLRLYLLGDLLYLLGDLLCRMWNRLRGVNCGSLLDWDLGSVMLRGYLVGWCVGNEWLLWR